MSRITYTKQGSPKILKTSKKGNLYMSEVSLPIFMAPLKHRIIWKFGNFVGFNNIRQNATKSRGFGIQEKLFNKRTGKFEARTSTAFNFGRWVGYKQKMIIDDPDMLLWYKRTTINGNTDAIWDFTPVNKHNSSMQSLRTQVRGN